MRVVGKLGSLDVPAHHGRKEQKKDRPYLTGIESRVYDKQGYLYTHKYIGEKRRRLLQREQSVAAKVKKWKFNEEHDRYVASRHLSAKNGK